MEAFLKLPRYTFVANSIAYAPRRQGVYGLFDMDDLIFIGAADAIHGTIRACLTGHADGEHGECTKSATRYAWELILPPGERLTALLTQFNERNRCDPRCHQKRGPAR